MANEISFEIERHLGVLKEESFGWKREVNLISWNGRPAKVDVRTWDESHERMTRGITLTLDEARLLVDALRSVL